MAAGMLLAGTSMASAQDWRDYHSDYRSDYRQYRDIRQDNYRVARMRADMNRDQARLNEDIRCGRTAAAARDARDLARDQQALNGQVRDIQRDYWRR